MRARGRSPGPRLSFVAAALLSAAAVAGCGSSGPAGGPVVGLQGGQSAAAQRLGFPDFATKNTTRVGGADPVADAAAVARAVFPATSALDRPSALTLVETRDWRVALAASVLMSPPLRAPLLFSQGGQLPAASADALHVLAPSGAQAAGGAQVIRVGGAPAVGGLREASIPGRDPLALTGAIDSFSARLHGAASDRVVVVSADDPGYAMPAAGYAAKSGDPILFVHRDSVPAQTTAALATHQQPTIYVVGPGDVISESVVNELRKQGTVKRVRGTGAIDNAIAFARYSDGPFGWGVVDPGHGLVFASSTRPLDAAAAAPLSATGSYGPLLLVQSPAALPPALDQYLLDIQPGYNRNPVRGVYNHGWLIGDEHAMSLATQGRIDTDLEIVPVAGRTPAPTSAPPSSP